MFLMKKIIYILFFLVSSALASSALVSYAASPLNTEEAFTFQAISQQFTKSSNMQGDFIQFEPNGAQSEGRFYLKRPGKVKFDYNRPSPILVKADGETIGVHNRQLQTWDYYPLRKTPLSIVLAQSIDVAHDSIQSVDIDKELVTIVLADKSLFGDSKISLMFDPMTYDLRQWIVHDRQGRDTTVVIYNIERDIELENQIFALDESQ